MKRLIILLLVLAASTSFAASKNITEFDELTSPGSSDWMYIVHSSADKKISFANVAGGIEYLLGIYGITDSTSTTSSSTAASATGVKAAYDLANGKLTQSSGAYANLPATCTYPAVYFASDTKEYFFCTASNEWYKAFGKGSDGTFKATFPNNTSATPTASTDELYFEGNAFKVNENGTERLVAAAAAREVDGHASGSLSADQVSGTVVYNNGMGTADVALTLPTAAAGLNALFEVYTAQSYKWGVRAGTNDKIYLIASDGTISAGSDNGYARMTNAQAGQSFACWTFKTDAYDWKCKAIAVGTSTFAAN